MMDVRRGMSAWLWMALVGAASLGLSRAFACVTPFASIAVVAAFTLPRREAAGLVVFTWAANQAIGFGLLHYPLDASTFGWGGAIGGAALAGLLVAWALARVPALPSAAGIALGVPLAFAGYEAVLLLATAILPSGPGAFAPLLLVQMLGWNVAAASVMLVPYRLVFHSTRRGAGSLASS